MSQHTLPVWAYILVFILLIALTGLTLGVSFQPISGGWHITIGLAIALVKATLVALFFMHVISSPRLTWIVIAVAIFWLVIMVSLTFSDYLTRGLIPYMPGH